MTEYSKEQLWELYEQLPENLKQAVFSSDIGDLVKEICSSDEISEDNQTSILRKIGYVFLGILTPNEFQIFLEKDLELDGKKAVSIFAKINDEIFINLKDDLEALYGITLDKISSVVIKQAPVKKSKTDKYLEPIE